MFLRKKGIRVLVVDFQESNLSTLRNFLMSSGYQVCTAKKGEEAIRFLEDNFCELVVINALLPDISGLEVSEKIKKMQLKKKPVIILMSDITPTANFISLCKNKWLIDEYIVKPFNINELISKINLFFYVTKPSFYRYRSSVKTKEKSSKTEIQNEIDIPIYFNSEKIKINRSGNCKEIPFPRFLYFLYLAKFSGILELQKNRSDINDYYIEVYFKNGQPKSISTDKNDENYLKSIIYLLGKLSKEETFDNLNSSSSFKESILKRGIISKEELNNIIEFQNQEKLLKVFAWDEVYYHLSCNSLEKKDFQNINKSLITIVSEGIARYYNLDRITEELNPLMKGIIKKDRDSSIDPLELGLTENELSLFNLIDGTKTLESILTYKTQGVPFMIRSIYTFLSLGLIKFEGTQRVNEVIL